MNGGSHTTGYILIGNNQTTLKSFTDKRKLHPENKPNTVSTIDATPQRQESTSKAENPIINKVMEKNGASPKVEEDTAAQSIPFMRFMRFLTILF